MLYTPTKHKILKCMCGSDLLDVDVHNDGRIIVRLMKYIYTYVREDEEKILKLLEGFSWETMRCWQKVFFFYLNVNL